MMAGEIIATTVGGVTVVGYGWLVFTRGFARTWDAARVALREMLTLRLPVIRLPRLPRYAEGGVIRPPRRQIDLERLEAVADIPMVDIIEAAEWRAEHPHEPVPAILTELDTDAWAPRRPIVDRTECPAEVIPRGMAYVPIAPNIKRSSLGGFFNEYGKPRLAKMPELPVRVEIRPPSYADCQHEDAEDAEVMSHGSSVPVKRVVTSCLRCEFAHQQAVLRGLVAKIEEILADVQCGPNGDLQMPEDLYRRYQVLLKRADEAKTLIQELAAALSVRDNCRIPTK